MHLDRSWIAARIAHNGGMCVLDEVLDWSARHIRCRTGSHRLADNPLRAHGRLAAVCAIEYAAQAIAVHGALASPLPAGAARGGYLASVRDVSVRVARLDDIEDDLICEADRIAGDHGVVLYEFSVGRATTPASALALGRATIILDTDSLDPA